MNKMSHDGSSRKLDAEGGTLAYLGVGDVDFALVVLGDYSLGQRETQTPAALLGGVTWIEYASP